jgi:hypothetical protein
MDPGPVWAGSVPNSDGPTRSTPKWAKVLDGKFVRAVVAPTVVNGTCVEYPGRKRSDHVPVAVTNGAGNDGR